VATNQSVEDRLSQLEREVVRLKLRAKAILPKENWISSVTGTAKDNPDYEKIVRLGKEIRDAEQSPED
jgi:hypothetical protein